MTIIYWIYFNCPLKDTAPQTLHFIFYCLLFCSNSRFKSSPEIITSETFCKTCCKFLEFSKSSNSNIHCNSTRVSCLLKNIFLKMKEGGVVGDERSILEGGGEGYWVWWCIKQLCHPLVHHNSSTKINNSLQLSQTSALVSRKSYKCFFCLLSAFICSLWKPFLGFLDCLFVHFDQAMLITVSFVWMHIKN